MLCRTMSALTPPTLSPGAEVLGQYVLRQRVGQGMGGETWRASPLAGGEDVAIKAVQHGGLRLRQHRDLIREAALLRDLDHPHVVPYLGIVDFPGAGATFLIVAWAAGGNLAAWMTGRGRVPTDEARALALQLCSALEATHAAGILHRDLKPENVLLRDRSAPLPHLMLADFGISQRMAGNVADVTRPAGSPGFTAPECWHSGAVGAAADVYSLGALLLTFVRGTPPPLAADGVFPDVQRLSARVEDSVEASARPLARLGIRMLAPDPLQRPTLAEVRGVLENPAPPGGMAERAPPVPTLPAAAGRAPAPVGPGGRARPGLTLVPEFGRTARLAVLLGATVALLFLVGLAALAWTWALRRETTEHEPQAEVAPAPERPPGPATQTVSTPSPPASASPSATTPTAVTPASAPTSPASAAGPPSGVAVPATPAAVGDALDARGEVGAGASSTARSPSSRVLARPGGPVGEIRVGVQAPGGFPADVRLVVRAAGVAEASSSSSQLTVRGARAGALEVEVRSSTRSLATAAVTVPEGDLVRVLCSAPDADFSGMRCEVRTSMP